MVANNQPLPRKVVEHLVLKFESEFKSEPGQYKEELLEIFFHLVRNHQDLPHAVFQDLENTLGNPEGGSDGEPKISLSMTDKILRIFLLKGQRGDLLSFKVMSHLVFLFSKKSDDFFDAAMKQSCLDSMCTMLEKIHPSEPGPYADLFRTVETLLIDCLNDPQLHRVQACMHGLEILKAKHIYNKPCPPIHSYRLNSSNN